MMRAIQEKFHALRVLFVGMGIIGLLSACASEAQVELEQALPCPGVGILGGTENLTSFSGAGNDITDIALTAELERVVSRCEYDIDDGIIYVDLAVRGVAEIGPAAASREVTVPMFIALTEINSRVLRKDTFLLPLTFEGNQRTTRFIHTIEETKVPYVARIDGSAYEILVGFQLTPEELAYNKRDR
ncbi:hypothetical protein QMT40_000737 [Parvibaculaceae bacterium PLY_AMNH_Bact1]|nr:hypothetical protein QMT40_000737 [Parvibaculaceae bacterium PLY_AMNH_Bact1]